jgi:hypothetical protein
VITLLIIDLSELARAMIGTRIVAGDEFDLSVTGVIESVYGESHQDWRVSLANGRAVMRLHG